MKPKLPVKKGDFLILRPEGAKRYILVKAKSESTGQPFTALLESSKIENKRVTSEYLFNAIVTNLGQAPPWGRVYGCLVEPLRYSKDIDNWGELHCYRRLDKDEKTTIKKALKLAWADVVKIKATSIAPLTFEIRHAVGRWDGHFHKHQKFETDLICLKPKVFELHGLVGLIRHEFFHAIYFNKVSDAYKVRWIKLYAYYISLHTAKNTLIETLRKRLVKKGSLNDFRQELREENAENDEPINSMSIFDECISYLSSTHNLDKQEIALLVDGGDDLTDYWPKHSFDLPNPKTVMTEYASTCVKEFFAEAGRLYLEGKAPKKVKKLMIKTLANIKE